MLAGVVTATLILNPATAYQIKSNLVAGFQAVTATDTKAENNIVALGADSKLPTDIIPASAVGGSSKSGGWCQSMMVKESDLSTIYASCGIGYSKSVMRGYSWGHPIGFGTPGGSIQLNGSNRNGSSNRYHASVCCLPD